MDGTLLFFIGEYNSISITTRRSRMLYVLKRFLLRLPMNLISLFNSPIPVALRWSCIFVLWTNSTRFPTIAYGTATSSNHCDRNRPISTGGLICMGSQRASRLRGGNGRIIRHEQVDEYIATYSFKAIAMHIYEGVTSPTTGIRGKVVILKTESQFTTPRGLYSTRRRCHSWSERRWKWGDNFIISRWRLWTIWREIEFGNTLEPFISMCIHISYFVSKFKFINGNYIKTRL